MTEKTKTSELHDKDLDEVAAAGHSQCEGDDGRGTGGGGSGSGGSGTRHAHFNQLTSYIDPS